MVKKNGHTTAAPIIITSAAVIVMISFVFFDFALILGKKTNTNELKEWIIGVNATARDIDTLGLRKNSISLSSIRKEDGKLKFTDEVIVGQIPLKVIDPITYATSEETTSGLYATSVFLTGTLTTRYNSLTN